MGDRPSAVIARLPGEPGVYRFRDGRGRVLYLGRAVNLRRRVASYWGDLGDRAHLTRMVDAVARVEALVCDSEHEAAWAERNLLERSLPRWNRTPGGQESPVYICVDGSVRTPGLKAVYRPRESAGVRHFGPYLGGLKARTAITALHRAYPLAYTGTGVTAAERELAQARGVDPGDHTRCLAAVTAVLDRQPTAVTALRAELSRRRDDAAGALEFEFAARLQAEIAAVDWVVSTQRVTTMAADDVDFSAWRDGVLVRFEVRAGRLCGWRQRSTPRPPAVPDPPPSWRRFAARNAELAAALTRPIDVRRHPDSAAHR
jgi:excinuclease ABC subunit C